MKEESMAEWAQFWFVEFLRGFVWGAGFATGILLIVRIYEALGW